MLGLVALPLFQEVLHRFTSPQTSGQAHPDLLDLFGVVSKGIDLLEGRGIRHGLRVAMIAGAIARGMSLPRRELTAVVYAAMLHDVGLASIVPDLMPHLPHGLTEKELFRAHTLLNPQLVGLNTSARLSPKAIQTLQRHTQAASGFLRVCHVSSDVQEIIASHHELFDGSGYPVGLSGADIPLGARIVAFADVVASLLEEVQGLEARLQALDVFMETQLKGKFDPEVAKALRVVVFGDELQGKAFMRRLFSLELESALREVVSPRSTPVPGGTVLDIALATSRLVDGLTPTYTKHHSERVAHLALNIGVRLGIAPPQQGELLLASLFHDIGHFALPVRLLSRVDPLGQEDWQQIREHPHYSEMALKGVPGFENVSLWASEHHERLNANGYPIKKRGQDISVGGRILAIADVFDALTSRRPYRAHVYEPMDALPILGQGRYRLFDSHLVGELREIVLNAEVPSAQDLLDRSRHRSRSPQNRPPSFSRSPLPKPPSPVQLPVPPVPVPEVLSASVTLPAASRLLPPAATLPGNWPIKPSLKGSSTPGPSFLSRK